MSGRSCPPVPSPAPFVAGKKALPAACCSFSTAWRANSAGSPFSYRLDADSRVRLGKTPWYEPRTRAFVADPITGAIQSRDSITAIGATDNLCMNFYRVNRARYTYATDMHERCSPNLSLAITKLAGTPSAHFLFSDYVRICCHSQPCRCPSAHHHGSRTHGIRVQGEDSFAG